MNPLESALNNYVCRKSKDATDNLICQDSFIAGWDARNEHIYGKVAKDIEKCINFIAESKNILQVFGGKRARDFLESIEGEE